MAEYPTDGTFLMDQVIGSVLMDGTGLTIDIAPEFGANFCR